MNQWFVDEFARSQGFEPFPWQDRMFESFLESDFPDDLTCDIPTGLGKTAVLPIWLMARKYLESIGGTIHPHLHRLAYVVNRRTIIDQATTELERICAFYQKEKWPISVTAMRGGLASTDKWYSLDRPAIIAGTPDMVASKLLFGGYGDSSYHRPIHAGLLGYRTLFVIDEAHLSQPLCELLKQVRQLQLNGSCQWFKPIKTMFLTATPTTCTRSITIGADDLQNTEVAKRLNAVRIIHTHKVSSKPDLRKRIIDTAISYANSDSRVLIYIRSPEFAIDIHTALSKKHQSVLLTGTIRGHERDKLLLDPVITRFREGTGGKTVYLVSTSAGEVGWDIDADYMITDSMPLDTEIQRLGRLNRRGNNPFASAHIVHLENKKPSEFDDICGRAYEKLTEWDNKSLSPSGMRVWVSTLGQVYYDLCAPKPACVDLTEYDIDAWSLTSIYDDLPGKRPLKWFIHGKDNEIPDTYLAWRNEVPLLAETNADLASWYKSCKPLAHELLRDTSERVRIELGKLANLMPDDYTVIDIDSCGVIRAITLLDLLKEEEIKKSIELHTIVLPSGDGLSDGGMLDVGEWSVGSKPSRDVYECNKPSCDGLYTDKRRFIMRVNDDDSCSLESFTGVVTEYETIKACYDAFPGSRLKRLSSDDKCLVIVTKKIEYTSSGVVLLSDHNTGVGREAESLCKIAGLPFEEVLRMAGDHHDDGKAAEIWQRAVRNPPGAEPIAKSIRGMDPSILGDRKNGVYRHEFGSYVGLPNCDDLIEYLVWSHHGNGRPHFKPGAIGPDGPMGKLNEVPSKFAKLQKKYGHWGLAILHAILCLADGRQSNDRQNTSQT